MLKNFHKNKYNSGVTIIELLVVITILAIMSATTLFSYSKFRSTMSIQNLADDIALSIRKAQSFAVGTIHSYSDSYGVHFTTSSDTSRPFRSSQKAFVLFANISDYSKYNYGSGICGSPTLGNECLEILQITSSDEIYKIIYGTAGLNDWREFEVRSSESVDVFFRRPNLEPTFCFKSNPNTSFCNEDIDIAYIKILVQNVNNPGIYKTITIWNNGQISVS